MKLINSEKADADVIGHVIILGITILGVSMVALYGIPAIYSMQDVAIVKNAEQTFTVMDSRTSRVLLGASPIQILDMNLGGGTLTVEPNSTGKESYVTIRREKESSNITIPMGKITYSLGDRIVAYEGGAVFSKYPSGGTVMLSPPEFHYNGVTLTLPEITITGNDSIGGKGTASINIRKNATLILYPNSSFTNRTNPLNGSDGLGEVYVNITSEFYSAWAEYARSLSFTGVNTNSTTNRAIIKLKVVPVTLGGVTSMSNPIDLRGLDPLDPTPLTNFSFRLVPDGNSFDWDIRAYSGERTLIFHFKGKADPGEKVTLNIGYQDDGPGYIKPAEIWEGNDLFTVQPDRSIDANLLNKSLNLTYDAETVGAKNSCTPDKVDSGKFNLTNSTHGGFSWAEPQFMGGTTKKSLYDITQHYIQKLAQEGDISFYQCYPSGQGPSTSSSMLVNYNSTGALTYLHISQNIADVRIS